MLELKRIDAIAGDLKLISMIAKREHVSLGDIIHFNKSALPLNFIMSKKSSFINDFKSINQALVDMVNSAEVESIVLDAFDSHNEKLN